MMYSRCRFTVGFLLAFSLLTVGSPAETPAQVPSFRDVVGHDFGERITVHSDMVRYLEALERSSDRVRVENQGRSWQEKSLLLAIVTSPENHARLDEIQRNAQRLGDPRTTSPAEAASLIEGQPTVVWFGGSIHGFELSGTEALLRILETLTTRNDDAVLDILRNVVVLIDPMLNPDGRDSHAHYNHERLGRVVNPERDDWANDFTSWQALTYRTGHYFFDTNRDWFAHTQRETRNRVETLQAWRPQVLVDAHEMGADVEFYFDPPDDPFGPYFPEYARAGFDRFNRDYAQAFDSAGFEYMTRERYNFFYPGYTTSWGTYQGAIGMLYEQGSTRGLALTRPDGSVRTLFDALEQQYTAAWSALGTSARDRRELLQGYYDAHRAAIADGAEGYRRYLLAPEGDPALVAELVNALIRNGVEVGRLTADARLRNVRDRNGQGLSERTFPAGSYVVEAGQPRNRLIRVLLEPDVPLDDDFLAVARARIDRDENPRFYDITSWSLPLFFNVGGYSTTDGASLAVERVEEAAVPAGDAHRPGYAYLLDGRNAGSMAALYHLRAGGHRASVTLRATEIEGQPVPAGTVVVRLGQNEETVHDAVREMAARFGVSVRAVDTGLAPPGFRSLGSADVIPVSLPEIAIVSEDPVLALSFGFAWYTLDRHYEIPTTVVRAGSLAGADLRRFDVLVLPELSGGPMATLLGTGGLENLRRWVREGGTLVTLGAATEFARESLELLALRSWYETEDGDGAQRLAVPGAFFHAVPDPESWLSAGYEGAFPVHVRSDRLYLEPEGPPSARRRTVVQVADGSPLLSGHAWSESLERVPGSVFLYEERVGSGRVIAFSEDPNFRAYWRGANRLFLNAVLLGPSAP